MACIRHTRLKVAVNFKLKKRAPCNTVCEVLTPVLLVLLFGLLFRLVDITTVPDATNECSSYSLSNQRHDLAYLPRTLAVTRQKLAVVGDPAVTSAFLGYLRAWYPGLSEADVSALGCSELDQEASYSLPKYFPSFDGTTTTYASESALESYITSTDYGVGEGNPEIYAAVVFTSAGALGSRGSGRWSYRLRMNLTDTPVTWQTGSPLQRAIQTQYIDNYVATSPSGSFVGQVNGSSILRQMYQPGFVPLQLAVDRFILNTTSAGLTQDEATPASGAVDGGALRARVLAFLDKANAVLGSRRLSTFDRATGQPVACAARASTAGVSEDEDSEDEFGGSAGRRAALLERLAQAVAMRAASSAADRSSSGSYGTVPPPVNASDWDILPFAGTWLCANETAFANPAALDAIKAFLRSHALLPQAAAVAPFPQKSFVTNGFYTAISQVFALAFCIAFFPAAFGVIRGIVAEKEAKLREGMRMMGYSDSALVGSWYISYGVIFTAISLAITAITRATFFGHSDVGLLFLLFFCFGMSALSLCWLISTLFSRAKLAALVGSTLFVGGVFPYFSVNAQTEARTIKLAASLASPTAFGLALDVISTLEANGVGLRPDTARSDGYTGMDFASVLAMLIFDAFLYAALAWYLHHTWPQEFGLQKPLWFPLTKAYWTGRGDGEAGGSGSGYSPLCAQGPLAALRRVWAVVTGKHVDRSAHDLLLGDSESGSTSGLVASGPGVEPPGPHLTALAEAQRYISIRGLRKVFPTPDGPKTAVGGVDLDFYEGQITCLLGHNGAGKTTTISMLTGLLPPTSGRVTVFGRDVSTDLSAIRQDLGVCPQHDVLWPELTVSEHLRFFAGVKGVPASEVEACVASSIKEVGLTEKVHAQSRQLSGGQKRKLSVAIALIGGSKVVVLDEPTSGMDPYSRRSTWEALQNARAGRCMVLTTHFMDEADLLGDRIAIMANGAVRCAGSSLFLKKLYDVGYQLTLVKGPGCDVGAIAALVGRHVPEGRLASNVGAELSFRLPLDASGSFPGLFAELEAGMASTSGSASGSSTPPPSPLGFLSFGVSVTSLEDVFLRVAEETEHGHGAPSTDADASPKDTGSLLPEGSRGAGYGSVTAGDGPISRAPSPSAPTAATYDSGEPGGSSFESYSSAHKSHGFGSVGAGLSSASSSAPESGLDVFWGHFRALVLKRARIALRDRRAQVFQLLIPVLALGAGLALLKVGATTAFPAMPLTLAVYNPATPHVGAGGKQANFIPWVSDARTASGLQQFIAGAGSAPGGANAGVGAAYGAAFVNLDQALIDSQYGPAAYARASAGSAFPCADAVAPWSPLDGISLPYLQTLYPTDAAAANVTHLWGTSQWLLDHRNGSQGTGTPSDSAREYGASRFGAFRIESAAPNPADGPLPPSSGAYVSYQLLTNTSGWHALPTYINVLHSGLLAWVSGSNASSISITNAPLPFTARQNTTVASIQSFIAVLLMVIAVAFIPPTFAVSLVKEREVGARHQQLISGVSLQAYWLSTYAWDVVNYLVPYSVFLILIAGFGITDLISGQAGAATALLLLLYGTSVAPFTYIMSFAFTSHSAAQTAVLVFNLMAVILLVASFVMQQIDSSGVCNADSRLKFVYRLFPGFSLGNALMNLSLIKQLPFLDTGCGTIPVATRLTRTYAPFDMDVAGWGMLFMAFESVGYMAVAYAIELGLAYPALRSKILPDRDVDAAGQRTGASADDDDDVVTEARRVDSGSADGEVVVFKHLRKVYGGAKVAVRDLTLGIRSGETFGLLGINGAGKTTSLKCLSGDVLPTSGTASVSGFDILTQQPSVRRLLGYCPQFDALLELLTVREHLELFAAIKRVPAHLAKGVVDAKIAEMDLSAYENKLAGTLSGGNKRKLSVAIATMGAKEGSVIVLDEPTTGVDPATKRKLWRTIARIASGGTSIILVSHSMEECEALCHRIGIAVGGRLRCLGSPQHLKHRFGRGYLAVVKLAPPSPERVAAIQRAVEARISGGAAGRVTLADVQPLCAALGAPERAAALCPEGSGWAVDAALRDPLGGGGAEPAAFAGWWAGDDAVSAADSFVCRTFPGSKLVERHGELLRFTLAKADPPQPLSAVFAAFEGSRATLGLQEYSISEPDLETVFNLLASQQQEERGTARGMAQA